MNITGFYDNEKDKDRQEILSFQKYDQDSATVKQIKIIQDIENEAGDD